MDYINIIENNDDDSGREKGSSKDRVISFLYRYRYKMVVSSKLHHGLVKNSLIKQSLKLRHQVVEKISSLNELNMRDIKYIEVDPQTEEFDFDKYDYYLIRSTRKKGIDPKTIKQDIQVKSGLSKIGSIKAQGLERRIDDTKGLVDNTRKELNKVRINLQYPVMHREDLSKMYHNIRENINDLKYEYEILKGETQNRSYAFEEAINIMDHITSYDMNSITKMDEMLKVASLELNKLSINSSIKRSQSKIEEKTDKKVSFKEDTLDINLYQNKLGYDEKEDKNKIETEKYTTEVVNQNLVQNNEEEKKETNLINQDEDNKIVEQVDETKKEQEILLEEPVATVKIPKEDVVNKKRLHELQLDVIEIKTYEEKIAYELTRQKEIINNMYKNIGKVTKEERKTYEVTGYGRMLSSLGNIAFGMVTLPFSRFRPFDIALGATLINRGVKKLKKGLDRKEVIKVNYKYEDFTKKLDSVEDTIEKVKYLINDSLEDLTELRSSFIREFSKYEYQIPDYYKTLKSMDVLRKRLKDNQNKINSIDKDLQVETEKNKVMIKKIENQEY